MPSLQLLDWDSQFFGFPVGRLDWGQDDWSADEILLRGRQGGFRLCYLFAKTPEQARIAAGIGAVSVNTRVVLFQDFHDNTNKCYVSIEDMAGTEDLPAITNLALQSAANSRFRIDPQMPEGKWQKLYREWAKKSLSGEMANAVLVERLDGVVAGMITLQQKAGRGSIGLFAVDEQARGKGYGARLLERAQRWFETQDCRRATVATQGDNAGALRAYDRAGYRVMSEESIFHLWLPV